MPGLPMHLVQELNVGTVDLYDIQRNDYRWFQSECNMPRAETWQGLFERKIAKLLHCCDFWKIYAGTRVHVLHFFYFIQMYSADI